MSSRSIGLYELVSELQKPTAVVVVVCQVVVLYMAAC